jgi:hypothetical protein
VTLGFPDGVRRKPRQLVSALGRRGHQSTELVIINMAIEWTVQIPNSLHLNTILRRNLLLTPVPLHRLDPNATSPREFPMLFPDFALNTPYTGTEIPA